MQRRNHLRRVVQELKDEARSLPYGIEIYSEDGGVIVGSKAWDLAFALTDEAIETGYYLENFEYMLPCLIQQIQNKASLQ